MKTNFYLKLFIGTIILTALNVLCDFVFALGDTISLNGILWSLLPNFLIVLVLGLYVSYSTLKKLKLAISVFVIHYLIGHFNLSIEAYIFNVTDRSKTIEEMLQGLFVAVFFAPIFVYLLAAWDGQKILLNLKSRPIMGWALRIFLGMFLYLIFYLAAGMILQATYPELMDFYKDKLPPLDIMIFTQFPRGLIFVVVAILVSRTSTLPLLRNAILIGSLFSILGAIAPLIPPSEFMPGNIRLVHGFEVGISNFIYGWVLGYLLGQKIQNEKLTASNP